MIFHRIRVGKDTGSKVGKRSFSNYTDWNYYSNIIEREIIATCTDEDGNSIEIPLSQSKDPETAQNYEADIPLESRLIRFFQNCEYVARPA